MPIQNSAEPFDAATASAAYRSALEVIGAVEPTVAGAIRSELTDQRESLKLIASENYASPAVLLTMGTWLSDKYAEGTIGHRFYAGCQNIDTVEQAAADHAKALFGAPHAYVQPHSGIDANLVAFWAILAQRVESPALRARPAPSTSTTCPTPTGRTLRQALGNQRALGMSLDAGGHLTHGFRPNISGKMFHQSSYGTDPETGLLDYAAVRATAREFQPLVLIAGYSAYPAQDQLRDDARDRRRGRRGADGRHGPLRRAGRRQGVHRRLRPGAARPRHDDHDAQVAARPARRHGAVPAGVRRLGRPRLPDGARRPARPRDGGQGGRAGRGPPARVPRLRAGRRRQRGGAGRRADEARRPPRHRRHREPPRADRRLRVRPHRPPGRVGAARLRHRHQPQRDPPRPERRLVHLRRADRHAGAHLARLRRRPSSTGSPS